MQPPKIILVTEAWQGLGRLTVGALAHGGHTVYAAVDSRSGERRRHADWFRAYARDQGVDVRAIPFDPTADDSVQSAVDRIAAASGRLDVVVHNPMQQLFGPAEAFPTAQLAQAHDRSILGAQRVMRACLPHMRRQAPGGLIVWIVSSAAGGGAAPHLAFHCAIAAGLDAMAVQYARDLAPWGIETSIVMPGMFSREINPLHDPVPPDDAVRAAEYDSGPGEGLSRTILHVGRRIPPDDAIPGAGAGAVAMVVDTPYRERPFRVYADPARDGVDVAMPVLDRIREEMIRRMGLARLLSPWEARNDAQPPPGPAPACPTDTVH